MEFTTFVRKPFSVNAVEITEDNIAEIAPLVGELKHKDDGTPYIQANKRLVPNVWRVYPGFYMTKMGDNIRCYSEQVFKKQFVANTSNVKILVSELNKKKVGDGEQMSS